MRRGGGQKRGRPEKGRDKPQETVAEPQPIWGMLYADDADISFPDRGTVTEPYEDDGRCRCSVRFVWTDSFGSQDGYHVPDDETYGQGHFRY